jgi:hypothetical protein
MTMLLQQRLCAIGPAKPDPAIPLPLEVALPGGGRATLTQRQRAGDYLLTIEQAVDPAGLELVRNTRSYRRTARGEEVEIPKVRVAPEALTAQHDAEDVLDALSLLTDAPFNHYASFDEPDELVPETEEDVELLDKTFGTREIYQPLGVTIHGRTFHEPVTPELIRALLPKRAGLQLYAEALHLATPQARYRDFWRILESAFGTADRPLLELLAQFPPLKEMDVTLDELKELHVYRGRASHAQSRSGVSELRHVRAFATEREGRLKCIVERVLMTKRDWGSRSLAIDELARLRSWIGPA